MWGSEADERAFGALWRLWNGTREERDRRGAVQGLTVLAEAGYAPAQHALGMACFDGEGVRRDYEAAFHWFMRSAEQGYPGAQNMVGSYYASVTPKAGACEHSPEEAVKWYRQAAEAGYPSAQMNLAQACWNGLGIERDPVEAYVWSGLAVLCSHIRFNPAEALRNRARAALAPDELERADRRIRELQAGMPAVSSDPGVYWRQLAERVAADGPR